MMATISLIQLMFAFDAVCLLLHINSSHIVPAMVNPHLQGHPSTIIYVTPASIPKLYYNLFWG